MMLSRLLLPVVVAMSAYAGDWLTYGHDPQRTGWAFEETKLTPENAGKLGLAWKTKLKNEPYSLSALTPPVVAAGISEALISTALGLIVAIIAVIFYNYFSQRIERINATIHICAARLIDAAQTGRKVNGH